MFLGRKEAKLADKLDKLLAGESIEMPAGLLEEKLWQVLCKLETNDRQRQAERESVLSLVSDISHQLKTPLAALSLHLELLEDESLTEEERMEFLSECQTQTKKIQWFSDALLKIARLETGLITVDKINADLVKTIKEAISSVKPLAMFKGLTIEEYLPNSLEIAHDPVWTKEALVNIMDNAIKYSTVGNITVTLEESAIYTRIDISDTGVGIYPDEYAKVFTRFYRARGSDINRTEGTGLGLTIAREILRQQGGNIIVSSEKGKGSVFSIFLQNC